MAVLKMGMVGLGGRGYSLMRDVMIPQMKEYGDFAYVGVCDLEQARIDATLELFDQNELPRPQATTDYAALLQMDIDAVFIAASWEVHVDFAVAAMQAGKRVALEVGGAYSLHDCWRLVDTYEQTGVPLMFMENCCYGQKELMVLNMVRKGLFGDVVFCEGGYAHDLRCEIGYGEENHHYRLRNYLNRNCDNYPTHDLGPIAKLLNINNGNRMLTLTSMASKAAGMKTFIPAHKGDDDKLVGAEWRQGDIVRTLIQCAGGELISLTLDTTLPRYYSRHFSVHGTKAYYTEDGDVLYIDGKDAAYEFNGKPLYGNGDRYAAEQPHPLWKEYVPQGGHDGIDWMEMRAFVDSALNGLNPPIDVYDAASWMCISVLSEQSVAMGGAPQAIPDFTNGKWTHRRDIQPQKYRLDAINE